MCTHTTTTLAKKIGTATRQRAQARDLSSMHAPVVDVRACFNFFGQGSSKNATVVLGLATSFCCKITRARCWRVQALRPIQILEMLGEYGSTPDSQSTSTSRSEAHLAQNLNGSDESDAQLRQSCAGCPDELDRFVWLTPLDSITIQLLLCLPWQLGSYVKSKQMTDLYFF